MVAGYRDCPYGYVILKDKGTYMTANIAIAPLTKVALSLRVETTDAQPVPEGSNTDFTFIYGIGTEGLTEFELALVGKSPGECLTLPIGKTNPATYFEHLLTPLMAVVRTHPPFDLKITIKSVDAATNRELVHALSQKADSTGCDCSSGCGEGCGCGG
jgi:hypothetical protein